jgi:energy-coupling factor transporter ATP-binding protein EcfA2
MNERQRAEFEAEMECNFAISLPNVCRFRVNVFVQQQSVGMVVRTIASEIPTFEKLDLPEVLKDVVMTKRGLVLVVGGTGSGKSTTLAAMIDYRNSNSAGHIITVEDPVEYVHKNKNCLVTHREVGVDTLSWHNALKNTLRQAPDVILIGEIRDTETMEHAIAFAETGHLCLGTLHANNANQTMDRIINFFPEERRNAAADGPVLEPARHRLAAPGAHRGRQGPQGGDRDPAEYPDHRRDDPEGELPQHQGDHAQVARTGHVHLRPGAVRALQQGPHQLRRSDPQRRLGQRPAPADQAVGRTPAPERGRRRAKSAELSMMADENRRRRPQGPLTTITSLLRQHVLLRRQEPKYNMPTFEQKLCTRATLQQRIGTSPNPSSSPTASSTSCTAAT